MEKIRKRRGRVAMATTKWSILLKKKERIEFSKRELWRIFLKIPVNLYEKRFLPKEKMKRSIR